MIIGFQECQHLCGKCRTGKVPFFLSTSGPWMLRDGLSTANCSSCGARHSVMLTVKDDGGVTITTKPL